MPTSPPYPVSAPHPLPRRSVLSGLAAAGAFALAGCSTDPPATPPPTTARTSAPAGPDPLLADIADTERLLSVYDQVLRVHVPLAARLRPLRANHAAHLNALRTAAGVTGSSTTPSGSAPAPKTAALALTQLRGLERTAAAARTRSAIRSTGGRAALLASIAACCASHQAVLA